MKLLILLLFALPVFGQNIRWDSTASTTNGVGTLVPILAMPGAAVAFYNACTSDPCSPTRATTYISASSSTQCDSGAQVVWQLSENQKCTSYADKQGNFGGYFQPGAYLYTVSLNGLTYGPYLFNVGGGGGSSGVSQIIAGTNVSISPTDGLGAVTISSSGASTHAPTNSIQIANSDGTLNSDTNFLIDPSTHTMMSNLNLAIHSMISVPRALVDPLDTQFLGGLAAAVAGTSGHTPTQVLNAAADYGYCLSKGSNNTGGAWIRTPAGWTLGLDSVKLWPKERIGSDSVATQTYFGHIGSATGPMITGHSNTDTIVCNGSTFTPGTATLNEVAFIAISGSFTGANDIGIFGNGFQWYNHDIQGWGTQFGQQAILTTGTSGYDTREGFPGSQISGCADFTRGVSTGTCETVELNQLDGFADHIYATDGATNLTGKGPGACYPNCAAIGVNGANMQADSLFAQISDIGIIDAGQGVRGSNWRIDGSSMEALRITNSFSNALVNNIYALGPCLSTSLQSNYTAGTATGCFAINNAVGQANQVYGITGAGSTFFGSSYTQCIINDPTNSGAATASTWGLIGFQGLPQNATANGLAFCGTNNSSASGRIFLPSSGVVPVTTASVNMNGITQMLLASGLTVTNFTHGTPGVTVTIQGSTSGPSSIAVSGNFHSCSGLPENLSQGTILQVQWNGQDSNVYEVCNPPSQTPTHVNWAGNGTPTDGSMVDVFGDSKLRSLPSFTINSAIQLFGSTAPSGHYCFVQRQSMTDGSFVVSPEVCSTVDLTGTVTGEIFSVGAPQTSTELWMTQNTTGSGIPTGKYAAASGGFWSATVVKAGGDGTTPPFSPSDNNTGRLSPANGIIGPSTAPSGTCSAAYGGELIVSQDGHGTFCPSGGGSWTTKF